MHLCIAFYNIFFAKLYSNFSNLKAETEEEKDDEVFENIGEMEMDLNALINKTFRLSDDYWFDPDE
jgi:hypothetical protein